MITALTAILVFLLVIVFHEFGHFMVAKLVNVKVNEFSIGMGPKLLQSQNGETRYTLRALPVGGYVSMEGEEEESVDPRGYSQASVGKRLAIIVAGAFMNFVLALLVLTIVYAMRGHETQTIGEFTPNSPLRAAGFESGDRISEIDGRAIDSWDTLLDAVGELQPEVPVSITALRGETPVEHTVTPIFDAETQRVQIGIVPALEKNPARIAGSVFSTFGVMLTAMFQFFAQLFQGGVGLNDLSGPVGIISTIGQASQAGLFTVLLLLALISVNVGFFNLLPIPALDGGKILFLILEAIRGKPLPQEKENLVHLIGFVLLMLLILVVTFKDVINLGVFGG